MINSYQNKVYKKIQKKDSITMSLIKILPLTIITKKN